VIDVERQQQQQQQRQQFADNDRDEQEDEEDRRYGKQRRVSFHESTPANIRGRNNKTRSDLHCEEEDSPQLFSDQVLVRRSPDKSSATQARHPANNVDCIDDFEDEYYYDHENGTYVPLMQDDSYSRDSATENACVHTGTDQLYTHTYRERLSPLCPKRNAAVSGTGTATGTGISLRTPSPHKPGIVPDIEGLGTPLSRAMIYEDLERVETCNPARLLPRTGSICNTNTGSSNAEESRCLSSNNAIELMRTVSMWIRDWSTGASTNEGGITVVAPLPQQCTALSEFGIWLVETAQLDLVSACTFYAYYVSLRYCTAPTLCIHCVYNGNDEVFYRDRKSGSEPETDRVLLY
jgi:hypothetical protein